MKQEELEKLSVEKKPGSSIEISGEVPFEYLEKHREAAVKTISKNVDVDGFRKGHVPEDMLIKKVGDMAILSEMAERALGEAYPEIVKMHELDVIGYPQINLTKLAKDNPLGFTITVAVVPEIKLPDYFKIAKDINGKKESKEVTDEDVTKQITEILRQKAAYERMQANAAKKSKADEAKNKVNAEGREGDLGQDLGGATELPTPETVSQSGGLAQEVASRDSDDNLNSSGTEKEKEHVHDENCDHDHEGQDEEKPLENIEDLKLPELTDEYVKTLGQSGQFESVEDFKTKIREHLTVQKAQEVDSMHRAKITDGIIDKTEMELPQVLVDAEIGQMFAQMEQDLKQAQLNMDDYLAHIKKTKEDLKNDWAPGAEKRAKLQLVLNEIAKTEEIKADPSLVDAEVDKLLEQYKDADKERVRVYVSSMLTNETVLKKLEDTK